MTTVVSNGYQHDLPVVVVTCIEELYRTGLPPTPKFISPNPYPLLSVCCRRYLSTRPLSRPPRSLSPLQRHFAVQPHFLPSIPILPVSQPTKSLPRTDTHHLLPSRRIHISPPRSTSSTQPLRCAVGMVCEPQQRTCRCCQETR